MGRKNPKDYTLNKEACQELVDKIARVWGDKGVSGVEVWVESIPIYNHRTGERISMRYEINSNILQDVASLEAGNYI